MSLFLGINTGHDSGVSLISDDEVVVAENEERYSRVKNHVGFPFLSLRNALKQIDPSQIQLVGIEGKKILPFYKAEKFESAEGSLFERYLDDSGLLKYFLGTKLGVSSIQHGFSIIQRERTNQIIQFLRNSDVNAPVEWFDHHHCHAASATLVQNRDGVILDGLSFSMDASGEGWCSKVYLLRKGQLIEQKEFRLPSYHSPANLYMHVTRFLGYRALRHEGKVTGLAAFGNHLKTA